MSTRGRHLLTIKMLSLFSRRREASINNKDAFSSFKNSNQGLILIISINRSLLAVEMEKAIA